MRARCPDRFALAATLLLGLALAPAARAEDTEGDDPAAPPYVNFSAPQLMSPRFPAGDVQWRRQDEGSQWFARVSLGDSSPVRALSGEVQWLFRGWDGHALAIGALVQRNLPPQGTPEAAVPDQRFGAYVNNDWQIGPGWRLVLGARADRMPSGEQALAPRAALLWQVRPDLSLRLVDGVAYREPNASLSPLRELVSQIDPALGNQRLRATEWGLNWHAAANLRLAASLYHNDAGKPSDAVVTGLSQGPLQFQNLGRANGNGVELGSEFAADAGWQVRASWAASRARNSGDAAPSDLPRTLAKLQAATPLPWRGARVGLEWWRVGPYGSALDAQHLLNATMDWAPTGTPWTLAASAYNLTGRTLADAGSADALQAALWRDGRRLQLQLGRNF